MANLTNQEVETPRDFFNICDKELNFEWDLAANEKNKKCAKWLGPGPGAFKANSLEVDWHLLGKGWLWLNPPFAKIEPWIKKCREEADKGAKIAVLLPASVDSNWYCNYIESESAVANVLFLNPRLKFVGYKSSFNRPCMLVLFFRAHYLLRPRSWKWKKAALRVYWH